MNCLSHADADSQRSDRTLVQMRAVLVVRAAAHGASRVEIFRHGVLREALRHDDRNLSAGELLFDGEAAVRRFLVGHESLDAAEVVDVGMGNQHRFDRTFAEVLLDERHRSLRAFHCHRCVEDDPPRVSRNQRDIRHVEAAYLVNAVRDLEQPGDMVVLCIFPKTGVCGVRGLFRFVEEIGGCLAPNDFARRILDFEGIDFGDQAAPCEFRFLFVIEIKNPEHFRILLDSRRRGGIVSVLVHVGIVLSRV